MTKIYKYLLLLLISISLINCKSVNISFLGYFNKEINKKVNVSTLSDEKIIIDSTQILISGFITDSLNHPIFEANVYLKKDSQIVSYAESKIDGSYFLITESIQPDTNESILQTTSNNTEKSYINEYLISASANGFKDEEKNIIIDKKAVCFDFKLKKLSIISGTVTESDHTPVKNALLLLEKDDKIISIKKTDAEGKFLLEQIENGTYSLSVTHNKYFFPKKTINISDNVDCSDIVFKSGSKEIYGFINTINNEKLATGIAILQKTNWESDDWGQPFQIVDTIGDDRCFRFNGLTAGNYKLTIKASEYGRASIDIILNEKQKRQEENITLTKEGIITGSLINYDPNETINFILINDLESYMVDEDNIDILGNGNYTIRGLSSGIYTIVTQWKGTLIYKKNVNIQVGRNTSNINITLKEPDGSISGKIKASSNNKPVENAIIIAASEDYANYAISNSDGYYKISGLASGTYDIIVNSEEYETINKSNILFERDDVLKNIDFDLKSK